MRTSSVKIALKVLLFAACMVAVDGVSGAVFGYLRSHSKGGPTQKDYYVSETCDADILVLGSSRAEHHYVPEILDSIGGLAYNGGTDGMGIVLGLGRYLLCSERHVPKILIYEVTPEFDYLDNGEDGAKSLYYLRPYYERAGIKPIFDKVSPRFEQLKMFSRMYRNSSKIVANITDFVFAGADNRGYVPVYGSMDSLALAEKKRMFFGVDSVKLGLLEQLTEETSKKGTKLYFAISPRYFSTPPKAMPTMYEPFAAMAQKYNVPLLDYEFVPGISDNPEMFVDKNHMNDEGARKYTRIIVEQVQAGN